ncbi:hypothetical protein ACUY3M_02390 [Corynebacterium suicordis]|uniref:Flagellar protein FlgN n=1 Tax=Corynebacterium suicordis DSM 45110 TaxID=1121369 RepID=A0ABR9ZHT8_9CORY|nr:hypothetical protein [Corynebacterium suicordis]MBF4552937.1 hypothetical protein [Corynebacterium suicordis DSM 45110]MDR6278103.1 hypothetical protein [Corynebacterium suicordis]
MDSGISTDPVAVRARAGELRTLQEGWARTLNQLTPNVPLSAFGTGLQSHGARLQELVNKRHEIRVAHARRLADAGRDAQLLAEVVESGDDSNAQTIGGVHS